ncbi:MAG: hypothetical protein AABY18_05320 [Candidatus Thermoplasmatota archaeon]
MRALVVAALFLLATLAVGTADAKPDPPQCIHGGIEVGAGPVTVRTNCGASPSVSVDPDCLRVEGC